ncbi:DUF2550 domain-containing protein [Actinotalea sp. AC32]|nr:DUF2550 domain-containing protein [Actinotalea sp. AC32]
MDVLAALLGVGALLLVAATVVGLFLSRQSTLSGRVGSFSCGLRADDGDEGAWTSGIAQYATGRLVWWRVLSLAPRPARTWSRTELTLAERIATDEVDHHGQALVRVRCAHGDESFQLLMTEPACAGLVSWLESGPRPVGRVI